MQSRYVRLTKDQAPLEDITPGELNQPIQVPQVSFSFFLLLYINNWCCVLNIDIQWLATNSWLFIDVRSVGSRYRKAISHQPMKIGPLAFVVVFKIPRVVRRLLTGFMFKVDNIILRVSDWFWCGAGWRGMLCPCVLFGENVETLKEEIPWQNACVCHAMCVEGGMAVAAATALIHGIDPQTSFLISESLLFAWWMCGIYTGLFRQSLQKKYHLKVTHTTFYFSHYSFSDLL